MKTPRLARFLTRGVFWRQLHFWAVRNIPFYLQPLIAVVWSQLFFLFATKVRRGAVHNLGAILPGSSRIVNSFRATATFLDFACTLTDTKRFEALGDLPDWEFEGLEHFDALKDPAQGAIILTAHMGSYDMGAYLFAERIKRPMTMIRAPEVDPETQQWEQATRKPATDAGVRVDFNTGSGMLALDLIQALRDRKIVAIQGDRVTPGIATFPSTLFGRPMLFPAGPFALAMATQTAIHPLFVLRVGWMRYRVVTTPPFHCTRTGRDRDKDIERAVLQWRGVLEGVIARHWSKWHMFEPFDKMTA